MDGRQSRGTPYWVVVFRRCGPDYGLGETEDWGGKCASVSVCQYVSCLPRWEEGLKLLSNKLRCSTVSRGAVQYCIAMH